MNVIELAIVLGYAGFLALLLAIVAIWRFAPGGESLGLWVLSAVLTFLCAVAQGLRWVATPDIAVAVAVDLTILAMITAYAAARRLMGLPSTPRVYAAAAIFGVVSTTWFTVVAPNFLLRSVAYAIVAIPTTLAIATVFFRAREPGLNAIFRVMGLCYGSYAVLTVVKTAGLLVTRPQEEVIEQPADVMINQLTVLPGLFLICLMLVLVTVRRAHAMVADDRDIAEETSQTLLADTWSDPLTGLASRARMRSILAAALTAGAHADATTSVFLVSLDGNLAQEYGHHVADEAMVAMAQQVKSIFGIHPHDWDTAGRWGETSVLVLPALGGLTAQQWALRARDGLQHLTTASGQVFSASVALIGVAPGTSTQSVDVAIRDAGARALDGGPAGVHLG